VPRRRLDMKATRSAENKPTYLVFNCTEKKALAARSSGIILEIIVVRLNPSRVQGGNFTTPRVVKLAAQGKRGNYYRYILALIYASMTRKIMLTIVDEIMDLTELQQCSLFLYVRLSLRFYENYS
jgi:hypothetical protein